MKMFFEEFGMVLVVMVIALSIITFSKTFSANMGEAIETQWTTLISEEIDNVRE